MRENFSKHHLHLKIFEKWIWTNEKSGAPFGSVTLLIINHVKLSDFFSPPSWLETPFLLPPFNFWLSPSLCCLHALKIEAHALGELRKDINVFCNISRNGLEIGIVEWTVWTRIPTFSISIPKFHNSNTISFHISYLYRTISDYINLVIYLIL